MVTGCYSDDEPTPHGRPRRPHGCPPQILAGLSAAASASYEGVTDSASSGEDYKELIKTDITEFQTDEYQIIREITTTVSINGVTATERDSKIVDAQPKDQELSLAELRQKANEYMKYRFGNNVTNNVYQETTTNCKPSNYSLV